MEKPQKLELGLGLPGVVISGAPFLSEVPGTAPPILLLFQLSCSLGLDGSRWGYRLRSVWVKMGADGGIDSGAFGSRWEQMGV